MLILKKPLGVSAEDAKLIADRLKEGPVRFVWEYRYTQYGVYMIPETAFVTRPERRLCSSA